MRNATSIGAPPRPPPPPHGSKRWVMPHRLGIPGGPAERPALTQATSLKTVERLEHAHLFSGGVKNHLVGEHGSRLELTIIRHAKMEPQSEK